MCLGDAIPGEVVAVVECPSAEYMPALHSALGSLAELADDAEEGRVKVMVHLTPDAVAHSREYQAWIAELPTWDHVMAGRAFDAAADGPSLYGAHHMQVRHVWAHQCVACSRPGAVPPAPRQG